MIKILDERDIPELKKLIEAMFEPITQEEYDALVAADAIESKPYFIKKETT